MAALRRLSWAVTPGCSSREQAFGDFEGDARARQAEAVQVVEQAFEGAALHKLARRGVDGDLDGAGLVPCVRRAFAPAQCRSGGFLKNPGADGVDEAKFLGHRDELGWRDRPAFLGASSAAGLRPCRCVRWPDPGWAGSAATADLRRGRCAGPCRVAGAVRRFPAWTGRSSRNGSGPRPWRGTWPGRRSSGCRSGRCRVGQLQGDADAGRDIGHIVPSWKGWQRDWMMSSAIRSMGARSDRPGSGHD